MRTQRRIAPAGSAGETAERRPTVSQEAERPAGERGLAEMYSDRVSQGRAPVSPRDHVIFGGNRANHQAGTKFAAGGFPYLFIVVTGMWFSWKAVVWLSMHGVSWKVVGGVLLLLCCLPMVLQALRPSNEYEINLEATLRQHANGTLQDSIIDPRRATEEDTAVPRTANGAVQVESLLGAVVSPSYAPPMLVVDGVSVDVPAGTGPAVARAASPRLGVVVSSGNTSDLTVDGELLTAHQLEQAEEQDGHDNCGGDGLVETV